MRTQELAKVAEEDEEMTRCDVQAQRPEPVRRTRSTPLPKKKDSSSGYCENCQDRFDDFNEVSDDRSWGLRARRLTLAQHVQSRKHRKFAEDPSNWAELDTLLSRLKRPLKPEFES